MKLILSALIALGLTPSAFAEFRVDLDLRVQKNDNGTFFQAYGYPGTFPSTPGADFTTGIIQTQDGTRRAQTTQGGWAFTNPESPHTFDELIASISQPWQIILDQGLASERRYTMSIELGALVENDLAPPEIFSPTSNGTILASNPHFELSYPTFVRTYLRDPLNLIADTVLFPGNQTWSPPIALIEGHEYLLEAESYETFSMGFSTPLDDLGNAMPGWSTGGRLERWTYYSFTAVVPEPATNVLLAAGIAFVLAVRGSRRRPF